MMKMCWTNLGWLLIGVLSVLSSISCRRDPNVGLKSSTADFNVVWNIPTQSCKDYGVDVDVKKYGILENDKNGWTGPVISIFYADQMGIYPEVKSDGTVLHGGIPQKVNLNNHIRKCEADINRVIPDRNFNGLGVIDYEGWRPIWRRNWDSKSVYQHLSEALVKKEHPDWTTAKVTQEATIQFEEAARDYLTATLETAKRLRPDGQWGYYLFPECYNYNGDTECSQSTQTDNNRLLWQFNTSTALYPSAYLHSAANSTLNANFVYGELHETFRLRKKLADPYKPIYLYSRVCYPTTLNWYTEVDLNNTIKQAHDLGMNGVVLWDDNRLHDNKTICQATKHYVDTVLGPFMQQWMNKDTRPKQEIVWPNRHSMRKPFNKRMYCGTSPCTRPHGLWLLEIIYSFIKRVFSVK